MAADCARREVTKPGFYHNLHSINHFHISETPWFKDLEPRRQGHLHHAALRIRPGAQRRHRARASGAIAKRPSPMSRAFPRRTPRRSATGTAGRGDHRANPDARTLRRAVAAGRARSAAGAHGDRPRLPRDRPTPAARRREELFENEHVKLLFLFKVSLFGTWLTDTLSKTSPMGSVIRAFDLETGYQLCQGGSFNLARGLMETFIAAGGTFAPQVAIERIVHRRRPCDGHRARRRPHRAGQAIRRQHARRASDVREI